MSLHKEIFMKFIPGYEGIYYATEDGKIVNAKTAKEKIARVNSRGYLDVNLSKNGKQKTHRLHRLIAATFIGPDDRPINHIDHNKLNNAVSNLEYTTIAENNRAYRRLLDPSWVPPEQRPKQKNRRGPKPMAVVAFHPAGQTIAFNSIADAEAVGFTAAGVSL